MELEERFSYTLLWGCYCFHKKFVGNPLFQQEPCTPFDEWNAPQYNEKPMKFHGKRASFPQPPIVSDVLFLTLDIPSYGNSNSFCTYLYFRNIQNLVKHTMVWLKLLRKIISTIFVKLILRWESSMFWIRGTGKLFLITCFFLKEPLYKEPRSKPKI